ncbi:mannosyl-glycoprotein endo-beta-N-acetylglucosamidase, partial [Lactobacillus reuteri]
TGVQQWAGSYYYFDPVTYLRVDNDYRQSQWGDWYLFGNDGRILSGLQKWFGSYYYFDPVTYLKVTNKNITVNGINLHADNDGILSGVNRNANFLLSIHDAALDGWRQFGVLPSVTAAQAILESAWGQSALATQGHNLFGIKGSYNGQSITMRTAEYGNGGYYYINDAFRKYPSNYESIVDHGRFLATNSRYNNLLWKKDYTVVTQYLHADGYATDPKYASSLNNVIRTYNLDAWDREVI